MKGKDLYKKIGYIDDELIIEADAENSQVVLRQRRKLNSTGDKQNLISYQNTERTKNKTKKSIIKLSALAACLVLLIIGVFSITGSKGKLIELSSMSKGVEVRYINNVPDVSSCADLAWLTEEEIFTNKSLVMFKGTIVEINNIEIDFKGSPEYRSIARIQVEKVYHGDIKVGDVVFVLVPCPINYIDKMGNTLWVEDTEVVSKMRAGMQGIFMPVKYDDESIIEINGARLVLTDITQYGFSDGQRYAFLDTNKGIKYADYVYESLTGAKSMDDVEKYILLCIEKYGL